MFGLHDRLHDLTHELEIILFRRKLPKVAEHSVFNKSKPIPSKLSHGLADPITLQCHHDSRQGVEVAKLITMLGISLEMNFKRIRAQEPTQAIQMNLLTTTNLSDGGARTISAFTKATVRLNRARRAAKAVDI